MKNKLQQVNQAYKKALGQILVNEFPGIVELTVSDVLIDPSYKHGRVWLRATDEVVGQVEERRVAIQAAMKNYVKTRYTPKLQFIQEEGYVERIDQLFEELEKHAPKSE